MKKEIFKVNEVSLHYKLKHDTTDYPIIKNSNDAAEILFGSWDKYTIGLEEQSKVLYLNRRNQVIGLYHFSTGNIEVAEW
jgi:DNA repair protein RadC